MDLSVTIAGFSTSLGLILAIGAQNAFVLRQGLLGRHVLAVVTVCAVSDAVLITAGVVAFGAASAALPWVDPLMRYAGAAFLIWFGLRSFHAAFTSTGALDAATADGGVRGKAVLTALVLTWANPHVYLDTVVLLGSISTQFEAERFAFWLGAVCASVVFFPSLGFGARLLRPIFAKPMTWRFLEAAIGTLMFAIAARLLHDG